MYKIGTEMYKFRIIDHLKLLRLNQNVEMQKYIFESVDLLCSYYYYLFIFEEFENFEMFDSILVLLVYFVL